MEELKVIEFLSGCGYYDVCKDNTVYGEGCGDGTGKGKWNGKGYGAGKGDPIHDYFSPFPPNSFNGSGDCDGMDWIDGTYSYYLCDYGRTIKSINGQKVYICDHEPTIFTSIHGNVAKGFILQEDLTLIKCYVVKKYNFFAHDTTLRGAVDKLKRTLYWNRSSLSDFFEITKNENGKAIIEELEKLYGHNSSE